MPATQQPNLGEIISALAAELDDPIAVDLFVDRVLARWPSSAKNPKANIRTKLRHEAADFDLLFTDRKRKWIAPLRVVMRGVRFRHLVSEQEAAMVALFLDEGETVFMPGSHWQALERLEDLRLVDETGQAIRTKIVHRTVKFDTLFGPQQVEIAGLKIPDWWRNHRVHAGDSLLLTIENFAPPHWRVEHEPAALRNEDAIGRRNTEIVGILFDMLEAQVREGMLTRDAVRTAFSLLSDPAGYPGDPWFDAIVADGRLSVDDLYIRYGEDRSGMWGDDLFGPYRFGAVDVEEPDESEKPGQAAAEIPPLAKADAGRVYVFKVTPAGNDKIWRRVEIQGAETLEELNDFLVSEFKHDSDHLGGFWKLVRRGGSKRTREVDLGTVQPYGGGSAAGMCIAEVELEVGQTLKWVFDFGDWHEYRLVLEATVEAAAAEAGVDYPRVVARNKPALLYCEDCRKRGKQVVATAICYQCSERDGQDFMVCEKCAGTRRHEDHYVEDWVY